MSESWLVTGVCAAGKTTVGRLLAERLGLSFVEGDAVRLPGDSPWAKDGDARWPLFSAIETVDTIVARADEARA